MRKLLLLTLLPLLAGIRDLSAQTERTDSLVRLMSAQQMELVERDGAAYRKVTGPARFLHNNTYLICDTAWWHVDLQQIEAIGHVRILQEETVLTGDKLTYYIDRDLAEFRGTLVQLEDKDHNMLRTRHMDYNTRDSVAVFQNGGSMKDKDGQIIESRTGTYDSKIKLFTFTDDVNMFTDSIFVKTTRLTYDTDRNYATFGHGTDAWKEDDMLSSDAGWYDRNRELFFFRDKVHGMTADQEVWADSLYYWRMTSDVEMSGHAQLTDTTRNVFALAGHMFYDDSLARITLTRDPAVVGVTGDKGEPADTVWFGADRMVYRTFPMCDIPEGTVEAARQRLEDLSQDAVMAYRRKAAEEAEKAKQDAMKDDPNNPDLAARRRAGTDRPALKKEGEPPSSVGPDAPEDPLPPVPDSLSGPRRSLASLRDSLAVPRDSLDSLRGSLPFRDSLALPDSLAAFPDSLAAAADSLTLGPVDSTKVGFLTAVGHARLFREDIQLIADSLAYNDLDSLVRLYRDPIVWNEIHRQYSSDSLYAVIRNRRMEKASLMSNAFIIIEEEKDLCYDQIRSTEMLAYFDSTGGLQRFDAMGDANAIFYLKEDSTFATVNLSQAKMLYAQFRDGEIDRVSYFDQIKNNAYPLAQMRTDERVLKGFNWQPQRRPVRREDITPLTLRPSQRPLYAARPRARFTQTDIYYPGYMTDVYKQIRENEAEKARRRREQALQDQARQDSLSLADSIRTVQPDSVAVPALSDSLSLDLPDTLSLAADSLVAPADTLTAVSDTVVAAPDPKALKKAEREAAARAREEARAAREAERERRWAQLDSIDAAKDRLKAEKKAEKLRKRKLKALQAAERQARRDQEKLEKYLRRYEKKKAREEEKLRRRLLRKGVGSPEGPSPLPLPVPENAAAVLSEENAAAALPEEETAAENSAGEDPEIPVTP